MIIVKNKKKRIEELKYNRKNNKEINKLQLKRKREIMNKKRKRNKTWPQLIESKLKKKLKNKST